MFCDIPHNWYKFQYGGSSPRDDLWRLVADSPNISTSRGHNSFSRSTFPRVQNPTYFANQGCNIVSGYVRNQNNSRFFNRRVDLNLHNEQKNCSKIEPICNYVEQKNYCSCKTHKVPECCCGTIDSQICCCDCHLSCCSLEESCNINTTDKENLCDTINKKADTCLMSIQCPCIKKELNIKKGECMCDRSENVCQFCKDKHSHNQCRWIKNKKTYETILDCKSSLIRSLSCFKLCKPDANSKISKGNNCSCTAERRRFFPVLLKFKKINKPDIQSMRKENCRRCKCCSQKKLLKRFCSGRCCKAKRKCIATCTDISPNKTCCKCRGFKRKDATVTHCCVCCKKQKIRNICCCKCWEFKELKECGCMTEEQPEDEGLKDETTQHNMQPVCSCNDSFQKTVSDLITTFDSKWKKSCINITVQSKNEEILQNNQITPLEKKSEELIGQIKRIGDCCYFILKESLSEEKSKEELESKKKEVINEDHNVFYSCCTQLSSLNVENGEEEILSQPSASVAENPACLDMNIKLLQTWGNICCKLVKETLLLSAQATVCSCKSKGENESEAKIDTSPPKKVKKKFFSKKGSK